MNRYKKALLDRIKHLEDAITKGREYLDTGNHAQWHGFRSLFDSKVRDGKTLVPVQRLGEEGVASQTRESSANAYRKLERLY